MAVSTPKQNPSFDSARKTCNKNVSLISNGLGLILTERFNLGRNKTMKNGTERNINLVGMETAQKLF